MSDPRVVNFWLDPNPEVAGPAFKGPFVVKLQLSRELFPMEREAFNDDWKDYYDPYDPAKVLVNGQLLEVELPGQLDVAKVSSWINLMENALTYLPEVIKTDDQKNSERHLGEVNKLRNLQSRYEE